jgi:drug/metabolite transporter (DMT)-like permease
MNIAVLLLVLSSALSNAYWNFTLKSSINKGADKILLYWLSSVAGIIFYFILFIFLVRNYKISQEGVILAALCGLFFALYTFSLSKSYELSDLSHAYPLSKTTPLFTLLIGIFYLNENITATAFAGIALVIFGVYAIHLKSFRLKGFLKPMLKRKGSIFALLTAIISAIYGLIYKISTTAINPFIFVYMSYFFLLIFYMPFLFLKSKSIISQIKKYRKDLIKIGVLDMLGAYLLIAALALSQLSYVFALRQIGVLFNVVGGIYFFKEKHGKTRLIASVIMIIGIFLISINT